MNYDNYDFLFLFIFFPCKPVLFPAAFLGGAQNVDALLST